MTELDQLRRAILIDPSNDVARLVYADALEQYGRTESDKALCEFIRIQMELEDIKLESWCKGDGSYVGELLCMEKGVPVKSYGSWAHRCLCRVCKLKRREYNVSKRFIMRDWNCGRENEFMPPWPTKDCYRRGFAFLIRCSMLVYFQSEGWEPWLAKVFGWHPVERVESTMLPGQTSRNGRNWFRYSEGPLANRLFATAKAASDAMSDWCVERGREIAGLPSLKPGFGWYKCCLEEMQNTAEAHFTDYIQADNEGAARAKYLEFKGIISTPSPIIIEFTGQKLPPIKAMRYKYTVQALIDFGYLPDDAVRYGRRIPGFTQTW